MRIFGNRTTVSLIAIATIGWCSSALAQKGPPVVTVATPLARNVVQWDEYTGRFEASERDPSRASVGLHRQGPLCRWRRRHAGRRAVHDRSTALRDRGRIGPRGRRPGAGAADARPNGLSEGARAGEIKDDN